MQLSLTLLSLGFAALALANEACPDDQISIGYAQFCNLGNPVGGSTCDAQLGSLWDSGCNQVDIEEEFQNANYCGVRYQNGASVFCAADGYSVTSVNFKGVLYGNCYEHPGSCSSGAFQIDNLAYCCSPVLG